MKIALTGVDPGIVDTGLVRINLDSDKREWAVHAQVFHRMVNHNEDKVYVDEQALLVMSVVAGATLAGVEGYRPRGRNMIQDRMMTTLVQRIGRIQEFQVEDNTGIRQVVTNHTLRLFKVDRFDLPTNHADLKSAARVALMRGYRDDAANEVICQFFEDMLYPEGTPWQLVSM